MIVTMIFATHFGVIFVFFGLLGFLVNYRVRLMSKNEICRRVQNDNTISSSKRRRVNNAGYDDPSSSAISPTLNNNGRNQRHSEIHNYDDYSDLLVKNIVSEYEEDAVWLLIYVNF